MSYSPIEHAASLRIGSVEFVSPDEIKVGLDLEAPDGIAANAGIPRSFPRINGYVLIATEAGYIVGQIEWIAVERSAFPKRKGLQDFGLVDLPFSLRKMRINPLGILKSEKDNQFVFKRGIQTFPSIGEPVLIPTDNQLRAIVESGDNRRVKIGTSPLAANAEVSVDPDRLFGRHLAVLGNTGSGKSCTVAGLIQWSLKAAEQVEKKPNARFIILDPNGEYSKVFKNNGRVFTVNSDENPLQVPIWFWNSSEWSSFTQAKAGAQAPLLKKALRAMRNENFDLNGNIDIEIKSFLKTIIVSLTHEQSIGSPWSSFPKPKNFFEKVCIWLVSLESFKSKLESTDNRLDDIIARLNLYKTARSGQYIKYDSSYVEIDELKELLLNSLKAFGGSEQQLLPKSEDIPIKFSGEVFVSFLETIARESGSEQYIEFLLARIRTIISDTRMKTIIGDEIKISLESWLENYIGKNQAEDGCVTIIDLSLVPSEIVHIVTAVIARITFEALQRYRKIEGKSLPTVLVMEEAHNFIKKYNNDGDNNNAADVCCQIFEKISREGRKFGLGLVLSSQRPSELSPTVLSQCNTFILHRLSNDRDQELVGKLVPDNLRGLLRELPSLPSQQAILLGWAFELPVMVRMDDLSDAERPHSDDPDFWDVWSRKDKNEKDVIRNIDWKKIVDDWQK